MEESGAMEARELQRCCDEAGLGWQVEIHDEVPSTSDFLRDRARTEEVTGRVVFAESQTAGRGRRSNRWVSGRGVDLLFSAALKPEGELVCWPRWTMGAALVVCEAVEAELGLQPLVKWPNDIYLRGRKVAGLLLEIVHGVTGPVVVLGIGVNVNGREFAMEVEAGATSLRLEMGERLRGRGIDRTALAFELLRGLAGMVKRLEQDFPQVLAAVRTRSWLMGKQVRLVHEGRERWGKVIDLDDEGCLVLLSAEGERLKLASAEQVRAVSP